MMVKKLGEDFINKIKEMLKLKEKRLQTEQQKLLEEDPYLQEGRDTDNAEEIDEAILEDRAKIEHDIKKENIEDMQKQVDKALDKMEKGEYGICEVCGQPIDKARLEVYPEATTCVDHARS
jgi:DnaK suppressor protein